MAVSWGDEMNSIQWWIVYFCLVAVYATYKIGDTIYIYWIIDLTEKVMAFEEACERFENGMEIDWP